MSEAVSEKMVSRRKATTVMPIKYPRFLAGTVLFALAVGSSAPGYAEPTYPPSQGDYIGAVVPRLEFHGSKVCASGCAVSKHPTPPLAPERFHELIASYAKQPMSEESPALEELLFYGAQTQFYLGGLKSTALDAPRLAFLTTELTRKQVVLEFRIIDELDTVRVSLPPTVVNLDKRYVFDPLNTQDFQPPEASGTVKRVGLNHLWQRI